MTPEWAENLPIETRVAAYARERGVRPAEAVYELAERGLRSCAEDRILADPAEQLPVYLLASMRAIQREMAEKRGKP